MLSRREIPRVFAAGFGIVLLGGAYLLVPDAMRSVMISALAGAVILAAMAWFPEGLVVGALFAGRYAYEDRLAIADTGISMNQLLLAAMVVLMIARLRFAAEALRQTAVRGLVSFVVVLTVWAMWTIGPEYGAQKVLRHWLVIVPAVIAGVTLVRWRGSIRWILLAFYGFGLGLTVVAVITGQTDLSGRTTALGSGPIVFARSAGLAMLISVLVMLAALRSRVLVGWRRWGLALLGGVSAAAMLPTFISAQSRGPVLALVVALGVVGLLLVRGDSRRSLLVALVGLAALLVANNMVSAMSGPSRFESDNQFATDSFQARTWMLRVSYEVLLDSPLIGVGTGGWPVAVFGIDYKAYPHNFFVEIAAEHGLLVGVAVMLVFFSQGLAALRAWSAAPDCLEREMLLIAFASYGYSLGYVQFSGDSVDNRVVWLTLGVMEASRLFLRRRLAADALQEQQAIDAPT